MTNRTNSTATVNAVKLATETAKLIVFITPVVLGVIYLVIQSGKSFNAF